MTDKLRTVAQQALEALEKFVSNELTVGQRYTNEGQQLLDTITALRERLAQSEHEIDSYGDGNVYRGLRSSDSKVKTIYAGSFDIEAVNKQTDESIAALRERLAQPEQEPVIVIKRNESGQIVMQTPAGNAFDMSKYIGSKFYTDQQKREWQGLLFAAVYEAWHSAGMDLLGGDWNTFVKTLETKLKEKNT